MLAFFSPPVILSGLLFILILRTKTLRVFARLIIIANNRELSRKKIEKSPYPSVSYEVADQIRKKTGIETRVTVPGHTQRGGSPCPYDRVLCSRLGAEAAQAIIDGDFGNMIGVKSNKVTRIPLEKVAGKLKMVEPDSQIIKEAKFMGISFGN